MQEDDETLLDMDVIDHDGLPSSVALEQAISEAGAENRGAREDPNEPTKNAGHNKEEDPDEFDFSLKGKKQRKTKTKKHIVPEDESGDPPREGRAKHRQNLPDMDGEGMSTSGTGRYYLPAPGPILIHSSVPGRSNRADTGSGTNVEEGQA